MNPNEIIYRRAVAADLETIVAMLADDHLGRMRDDPSIPLPVEYFRAFEAIDADPNQLLAVAVDGLEVVGTLQITFIPGIGRKGAWRGQIEAVRITASRRRSGLGQKFVEWAIAECKTRGCHIVQLTTDRSRVDAHRFYERLGFVQSHLGYKLQL